MRNRLQQIGRMGIVRRAFTYTLALAIMLAAVVTTQSAQAQTYTLLHQFTGVPDGNSPSGSLVGDQAGNYYGTTDSGGDYDNGTVFKLNTSGRYKVLYSFTGGQDGGDPYGGLIRDAAGNFYGTTVKGGAFNLGTVIKLNASGKFKVLYSFAGGADGAFPYASLIRDAAGNLYGTTTQGGASGYGTVFKLDPTGSETLLHSFTGEDGRDPNAGLIRDAAGNLYGTTTLGGNLGCGGGYGCGTVFKLDASGIETVLHSFSGGQDGEEPTHAGLIHDAAGNLYGTTAYGGTSDNGTVFKLNAGGKYKVLYSFTGANGANPKAGLIRDAAGNLYGTTLKGGSSDHGTVFKLDASGHQTVLHSFAGADGSYPSTGLIRDAAGNLYGTTAFGGASDFGTVFKVAP
jgi:uncharacterized repeat protein (TIGR03803 family)